jgi:hypothetical protein
MPAMRSAYSLPVESVTRGWKKALATRDGVWGAYMPCKCALNSRRVRNSCFGLLFTLLSSSAYKDALRRTAHHGARACTLQGLLRSSMHMFLLLFCSAARRSSVQALVLWDAGGPHTMSSQKPKFWYRAAQRALASPAFFPAEQ